MHIWKIECDQGEVQYFKDLEALSLYIAALDETKVEEFNVVSVYVND
jgi:hypothetical protein